MKVSKYNTSVLLHDVGQAQARKSQVGTRDYPHQILEELFYQEDNARMHYDETTTWNGRYTSFCGGGGGGLEWKSEGVEVQQIF